MDSDNTSSKFATSVFSSSTSPYHHGLSSSSADASTTGSSFFRTNSSEHNATLPKPVSENPPFSVGSSSTMHHQQFHHSCTPGNSSMTEGKAGPFLNKSTPSSSGPTQKNLMDLLGDLAQSKLNVENDQKAYEQNRLELNNLNGRLKQLHQKKIDTEKQIEESEIEYAQLSAELSLVLIKDKVVSEGLDSLQVDLVNGWDSLKDIRSKMFSVSGRYLGECTKFAQMYNCTEMGTENRRKLLTNELEEYRIQKQHLEYDLQKFLSMKAELEKSEKENRELQQQYRLQEETDRKRENEAYNKLLEAEQWLGQLEKKKSAMDKQLQDEINKLQAKLQTTKQSISYWERRVSENQRMVGFQNPLLSSTSCMVSSATSPGIPFPAPTIRLGNGQSVVTNNKTARIAQYVRPTLKVTNNNQPVVKEPPKPNPPKTIQTKLQFSNPMNPPLIRPTKPKFISPLTTARPAVSSFKNPVQSIPQNKTIDSDDDPFNDSFSSSQYFSPDPIFPSKTLPQPTATSLNNNGTVPSSLGLRTFQFKKKAVEGPHISGPTGRSISVTLGTTPYATFQKSRSILQEKQQ